MYEMVWAMPAHSPVNSSLQLPFHSVADCLSQLRKFIDTDSEPVFKIMWESLCAMGIYDMESHIPHVISLHGTVAYPHLKGVLRTHGESTPADFNDAILCIGTLIAKGEATTPVLIPSPHILENDQRVIIFSVGFRTMQPIVCLRLIDPPHQIIPTVYKVLVRKMK